MLTEFRQEYIMLLKELSKELNLSPKDDFIGIQNNIDIGDFTFTEYKRISRHIVRFTNKKNPNIILINNRNAIAIVLYQLNDTDFVDVTSWRNGNILHKNIPKKRINSKIFK